MSNYQTMDDVVAYIKQLEDRISVLEKTNPLNNGTVDEGGIVVKSPGEVSVTDSDGSGIVMFVDDDPGTGGRIRFEQNGVVLGYLGVDGTRQMTLYASDAGVVSTNTSGVDLYARNDTTTGLAKISVVAVATGDVGIFGLSFVQIDGDGIILEAGNKNLVLEAFGSDVKSATIGSWAQAPTGSWKPVLVNTIDGRLRASS